MTAAVRRLRRDAALYGWLARVFASPDERTLEAFPPPSPDLDLLSDHHSRLMLGRGSAQPVPSPLHETSCTRLGRFAGPQQMADIAGFYRAFGLRTGDGRGRPDHISAETGFMAFVLGLEADAVERGHAEHVATCREARTVFLREHLGRWSGVMARGVRALLPEDSPYVEAAEVLDRLVAGDARRLGIEIVPESASDTAEPDGDFTCPFAAPENAPEDMEAVR